MRDKRDIPESISDSIEYVFATPNILDSNFEPANVVDGLYAISRSIDRLADAMVKLAEVVDMSIEADSSGEADDE